MYHRTDRLMDVCPTRTNPDPEPGGNPGPEPGGNPGPEPSPQLLVYK